MESLIRGAQSLASGAYTFWGEVRAAVAVEMCRKGPLAVHALRGSPRATLKDRRARIGMPLTPAWLRYHLLRQPEEKEGVAEVEGRFALVEPAPPLRPASEPSTEVAGPEEPFPPRLSARRFWLLFAAEAHDTLTRERALAVEDILDRMPDGWIEATARYDRMGKRRTIRPGRLRQKLRNVSLRGASSRSSTTGAPPRWGS